MSSTVPSGAALVERLSDATVYPHPVDQVTVLETHISWVLLTGRYAYKLKKPVDLGFVDFTSVEKRRHYCFEELRLNRRLAPDLYLQVVPVTGSVERPALGGTGPTIDHLVKMREFEQRDLLLRLAQRGELGNEHVDRLAELISAFHANAEPAPAASRFGTPGEIDRWRAQNFTQIEPLLSACAQREQLAALRDWSEREQRRLTPLFAERKARGAVRDCHGDLHLGNAALVDGQVTVFDCIEFNRELRIIDVANEVAFLLMDLADHGYPGLGYRFLDRYLAGGGDYRMLSVLPFYWVYRALVRAKVDLLRLDQPGLDEHRRARVAADYQGYIDLAQTAALDRRRPALVVCHGLSASGKSALAAALVETLGAVRIRSDIERKRLSGLTPLEDSGSGVNTGLYTAAAGRQTYRRVAQQVGLALDAGFTAVADCASLSRRQRDLLGAEAERRGLDWLIVETVAPEATLRERIARRAERRDDPSEATLEVLRAQLTSREPLGADERTRALKVDTAATSPEDAARAVAGRLNATIISRR